MPSITHIKINDTIYDIKDQNALRVTSDAYVNSFTVSTGSPTITMKTNNIDLTATPTSDAVYSGGMAFTDSHNTIFARFRGVQYKAGSAVGAEMFACRQVNNTSYYNDFRLTVDSNGTRGAYFTEPKVIRDALGMSDSGWKTATSSSVFDGTIYYRKFYNFVEIRGFGLKLKTALSSSSVNLLAANTLPSDYRPSNSVACYAGSPSTAGAIGCMVIGTGGNVAFHKPSGSTWATTTNINFHVMYFVG